MIIGKQYIWQHDSNYTNLCETQIICVVTAIGPITEPNYTSPGAAKCRIERILSGDPTEYECEWLIVGNIKDLGTMGIIITEYVEPNDILKELLK